MSYWEHQRPVQRERALAITDIAAAATGLLDDGGLRALTLRSVAGELGVAPASLYSRVEGVDDLFDLALDHALGADAELGGALGGASIEELLMALYRHLVRHPWACQVIAMRAPRGPRYLELSERMCVLLEDRGVRDPLSLSYALSNLVIGSAATAPVAPRERAAAIDPVLAPTYARLHAAHRETPELAVAAGVTALLAAGSAG
ncbi:MAG: TetR/AcrR family transcriptional regulator [Leucobacter sp.]